MDDELGILLNNSADILMNETEFEEFQNTKGVDDYLFDIVAIVISVAAVFCDALIIYTYVKTRWMRTRLNLFVLHIVVFDILYALQCPQRLWLFVDVMVETIGNRFVYCIVVLAESLIQFYSVLFILFIISNTIMKSTKINDTIFICIADGILLSMCILNSVLCSFKIHYVFFVQYAVCILAIFITMICKEINICCKRNEDPVSEETMFRMNIARIFIYNWMSIALIFLLLSKFSYKLAMWFTLSQYLNGIFFFIYLYHRDKKFRICVLNIFKCQARNYDVDATIRFAEDCQVASDIGEVNINFNNV